MFERLSLSSLALFGILVSACGSARGRSTTVPVPEKPPHLSATKFVAFGDSLTEGFVQRCPGPLDNVVARSALPLGFMLAPERAQPSPTAYPVKLQILLSERYEGQTFSILNEGMGGEDVETGAADLPRVLTADAPEVLLLQEGINTLNTSHAAGIPVIVEKLRLMIREARSRGATVLVGTLLPERQGGCRAYDYSDGVDDIVPANVQIRGMVGAEGAVLVDLYEAFNGRTALLIGEDGLHPSEAGYQTMAEVFFAAIRKHLED